VVRSNWRDTPATPTRSGLARLPRLSLPSRWRGLCRRERPRCGATVSPPLVRQVRPALAFFGVARQRPLSTFGRARASEASGTLCRMLAPDSRTRHPSNEGCRGLSQRVRTSSTFGPPARTSDTRSFVLLASRRNGPVSPVSWARARSGAAQHEFGLSRGLSRFSDDCRSEGHARIGVRSTSTVIGNVQNGTGTNDHPKCLLTADSKNRARRDRFGLWSREEPCRACRFSTLPFLTVRSRPRSLRRSPS